jgi:protein-tyrosine phosphatase
MLGDGLVHILASDTHNVGSRPPVLAEGWEIARRIVGDTEALHLVVTRPYGILNNDIAGSLPAPAVERLESITKNGVYAAYFGGEGRSRTTRVDDPAAGDSGGGVSGWMRRLFR